MTNNDSWRAIRATSAPRATPEETGEVTIPKRAEAWRAGAEALAEVGIGFAVVDAYETVCFGNAALAAMVGRGLDEVHDAPFADLFVLEDAAAVKQRVREAMFGAMSAAALTVRLRHAGRRPVAANVSMRAFERDGGRGRAVLAVIAPTAAQDEARSLRGALGSALDAIRQRDDFFAVAAHELRTPLTPLVLHLQATHRALEQDAPSVRRSLVVAEAQVKRLAHLVDQLLDVARVRAGRLVLERQTVDLATIVRDAVARFAGECVRTGSTIEVACPIPVLGRWDPMRVDQIVGNLISNALKYAPAKPVLVALSSDETRAMLRVQDRGYGIAPEHAASIFDRFERRANDASIRGSGLGLWIVKQLAEAHGGRIHVESEPGEGATFVVELPRG